MTRARPLLVGLLFALWTAPALAWEPLDECEPGLYSHWVQRPVSYRLNELGSADLSFADVGTVIATSWASWSDPCCSTFAVRYDGTTTSTATDQSAQNVISFAETSWPPDLGDASSTLGVTLTSTNADCVIGSADILFNGVNFVWVNGTPTTSDETDLQSVATHEQGHWLGLGHSDVPTATMWPTYDNGLGTRDLDVDDVTGLCIIYEAVEAACLDGNDEDCDGLLDCADDDCVIEPGCTCNATATIDCDETISGDTTTGVAFLTSFPACSALPTPGPELAYSFTPPFNGTVTLDLTNLGVDVDLIVSKDNCNPAFCEIANPELDLLDEHVIDLAVEGNATYFFVVDSAEDPGGTFDLTMSCVRVSEAACANGTDDDDDVLVDCEDDDCDGATCGPGGATCIGIDCICPGNQTTETLCDDGLDNDCDGGTDCGDTDCGGEACDADGRVCVGTSCSCPGGGLTELTCDDGQDNDCDGDADCDDADCYGLTCGANGRVCALTSEGTLCICPWGQLLELACNDALDNDCDGLVNCDDIDCEGLLCDATGSICQGGVCTCVPTAAVAEGGLNGNRAIECYDGADNDCDTFVDCDDPDCIAAPLQEAMCDDGLDNDCDGLIDCPDIPAGNPGDPECEGRMICAPDTELDCADGVDDDFDSDTDCDDIDCEDDPACQPEEDGGPAGDDDPGAGDSFSGGDSDTSNPPGGCGCAAGGEPLGTTGWLMLGLGLLLGWRRRRS